MCGVSFFSTLFLPKIWASRKRDPYVQSLHFTRWLAVDIRRVTPRAIMYPTVRNVGRGNTRCKKKFHLHTCMRAYKHACIPLPVGCIVESTCVAKTRLSAWRNRARSLSIASNGAEWIYGWTHFITGLLYVRYDGDDDGDVGMRTLTLVRAFVFHEAELASWSAGDAPDRR